MTELENRIAEAESAEELNEIRLLLFRENTRLENEKKRLKKDEALLERQLAILKDGFLKLDADRQSLEHEKQKFIKESLAQKTSAGETTHYPAQQAAEVLFRNADNPLALRKRYKDLVKIFHPDNLFGDGDLAQQINREYAKRRNGGRPDA